MPRLWTSPNLTFNEINCFFDAFLNKEDPHYRNLINLVLDPREPPEGKERHIPIPVALDSTKVRVQKSNDYAFQKSTFYTKLGKNFITFMNATAPDGTIFLTAYACPSVSPSHGDKRIIGRFLWRDQEAIQAGTQLPSGFHHLCKGTDQYFMVVLADLGFTYEGREMKVDEVIGKIESLQNDKFLGNTLIFISSQQLTCPSSARKTMLSSSTQ